MTAQIERYAIAKQFNRTHHAVRTLRTRVQRLCDRACVLLSMREPLFGRHVLHFAFDTVQPADELHRCGGDAPLVALHEVDEVAARMRLIPSL